jgi:2-(1,2-epoxy-1,2-dihydrophenyl)acetyl-CoA isomerase
MVAVSSPGNDTPARAMLRRRARTIRRRAHRGGGSEECPMSDAPILFETADGYAVVTLNRPDRLNSFNPDMHARLRAAVDEAGRRDDVRCLLITGAGRGFCAGQDLSDRVMSADSAPPDLAVTIDTLYNPLVRALRGLEKPVLCAVNGVAAGAGANIALACDIVLAARSASFIQAFCKIGLIPDSGGTYFLPRLVGSARAMGLAMLGDKLPAEEAERIGLIWKCVDDARLMDEARGLAKHLATQPTRGLAAIKRALQASAHHTLDEQLDMERDVQRELGRTHDYREGVAAFIGKRKPEFKGR